MPRNADEFFDEFDDVSHRVRVSRHQDFVQLLQRWFLIMEEAPRAISQRLAWLETLVGWKEVEEGMLKPQSGMGPGTIDWPLDRERRLSAQLSLFRNLATGSVDQAWNFANDYFATNQRNIDDILHRMTDYLFDDLRSELRRYFKRNLAEPLPEMLLQVPASDRVVALDHNSPEYGEAEEALAEVENQLQASNQGETEQKQRAIAEISAGRRLLQASSVRIGALMAVLGSALTWIATQFAETAAGKAAAWAIEKLLEFMPALSGMF